MNTARRTPRPLASRGVPRTRVRPHHDACRGAFSASGRSPRARWLSSIPGRVAGRGLQPPAPPAAGPLARLQDDDRLTLVYVPTHRDVKVLVAEVRAAARRLPAGGRPSIRILGSHAWPLPWYLRDLPGMEYRQDIPRHPDADVLIVQRGLEDRLRPLLRQRYRRREFLLRPRQPVAVYVKE